MGIFSEYVRNLKSQRSSHPLWSFSGIGKDVKKFLKQTIFQHMAKTLSLRDC